MNKIEIAQAIRADLKRAGIKGISVSRKYLAADIAVIIKLPKSAFITAEEFAEKFEICFPAEILDENGRKDLISLSSYLGFSPAQQEKIRTSAAKLEYSKQTENECSFYGDYRAGKNSVYTPETERMLEKINTIVKSYHYDRSNAMVDYIDTNFYYCIVTKPEK